MRLPDECRQLLFHEDRWHQQASCQKVSQSGQINRKIINQRRSKLSANNRLDAVMHPSKAAKLFWLLAYLTVTLSRMTLPGLVIFASSQQCPGYSGNLYLLNNCTHV
jgi:hypothetical protein